MVVLKFFQCVMSKISFLFCTGFVGYKLEGYFSDKYTPYNGKVPSIALHFYHMKPSTIYFGLFPFQNSTDSIQDRRSERLAEEEIDHDPTKVEKLRLKENVLERNLSPSLQRK